MVQILLGSFENRVRTYLVAIDETGIRSYEPELQCQLSEWHTPAWQKPIKFRRAQCHLKMMMIFAYDNTGILCAHQVLVGQTVKQEYYRMFLMDLLRPAIRKKQKTLLEGASLILHDNSACHESQRVTSLLTSYDLNVLPHPAYSPDMIPPPPPSPSPAPSDFDLFSVKGTSPRSALSWLRWPWIWSGQTS